MLLCSITHTIICTQLFRGKMHSDWFNGIEILKGRWQHGEKVGYCYSSRLEKTLCKWDICVPLVTRGLKSAGLESIQWHNAHNDFQVSHGIHVCVRIKSRTATSVSLKGLKK
jgi:hypothetical protein